MSKFLNVKSKIRPYYSPISSRLYKFFLGPKRYNNLYKTIKQIHPKTILEVGTWNGKRALEMIECAQKYHQTVTYIGFDLFEDLSEEMYKYELSKRPPTEKTVLELLEQTGATIQLIRGNTLETLKSFADMGKKVDFVYIDGGHHVDTIKSDWQNVERVMHKDTVVIFDDYWRNRTDQAAKSVVDAIDSEKYHVEILPEIDRFNNEDFGYLEISFAKVTLR